MRKIVFNGKFQSQKMTGVQRVGAALISTVIDLKAEGSADLTDLELTIANPAGLAAKAFPSLASPGQSRLKGVPWEQLELPFVAGRGLLVNLCNVAPLARTGDVLMVHDAQAFVAPESYSPAFALWYRTILPHLIRRASRVLTVSNYSKRCLIEAGVTGSKDIEVIHNGVDHILRSPADSAILDRLDLRSRPFIAAPASVQHHKNVRVLLGAAKLLTSADARLVLIGGASQEDFIAAGLELPSNVILAGRVTDGQMRALIEAARAFAFPSLTEGFGLPPLEAMLLGTPAVVAPAGAVPEVCAQGAVYADGSNPEAWAEALDKFLCDDGWRMHWSELGRAQAGRFAWSQAGGKLAKVLNEAAQ